MSKGRTQAQKIYVLKLKESKAKQLGTDASRLIDEMVGEYGNYLLGFFLFNS